VYAAQLTASKRREEIEMTEYRVAAETDLEPLDLKRVDAGRRRLCLARSEDGTWYAIGDTCSHQNYSLSQGDVWGMEVECPLHGSRFNLSTGQPDRLPATVPVPTYPVTIRAGEVYVEVMDLSPPD
jgi:3-phenylpropionate/trans-cinnamate dioxygenase ferredoxin component